jgi:hypothetical protein
MPEPSRWTPADVPAGPYLHGTRWRYRPGDLLHVDVVNNLPGEKDDRLMCFATTSSEDALKWAYRRGLAQGGDMLYVYEVELVDPEVDVNMHRPGVAEETTSVMSPKGTVVRLAHQLAVADYSQADFG